MKTDIRIFETIHALLQQRTDFLLGDELDCDAIDLTSIIDVLLAARMYILCDTWLAPITKCELESSVRRGGKNEKVL